MKKKPFELGAVKPITKVGIRPQDRKIVRPGDDTQLDPNQHSLACPNCKTVLDGAGGYSFSDSPEEARRDAESDREVRPRPGCPSVCCSCGQLLFYDGTDEHLILRAMTDKEWEDMKRDEPEAARFLAMARSMFLRRSLGVSLDELADNQQQGPLFWE